MSRGRHRKRSRASATTVRASVALTAAAVTTLTPVFGLPAASAEPSDSGNVWDRIAECESSGNWATDSGNGYAGGLQFSPSTWASFGGNGYATSPARASRAEQIAVAARVQRAQGWEAWPVCSKKARAAGSAPASGREDDDEVTTPSGRDGASTSVPESSEGSARSDSSTYVVRSGDTLSAIARLHASGTSVDVLARSNGIVDPNVIDVGQTLKLTSPSGEALPTPSSISVAPTASVSSTPRATNTHVATSDPVGFARTWIGVNYAWGGTSRSGVDCSGLVQRVFAQLGTELPRTAQAQYDATERVSRSEARPGDLVFGGSSGRIHHVGIYLGNGRQIDAPNEGETVGVHPLNRDETSFGRVK